MTYTLHRQSETMELYHTFDNGFTVKEEDIEPEWAPPQYAIKRVWVERRSCVRRWFRFQC